jgi:two-component system cell cycle sensor histidine kinase/response regulator CckA
MTDAAAHKPSPRRAQALIYVVDDEALMVDWASEHLQAAGYAVRKFQDPRRALQSLLKAKPKPVLLISDYAMNSMNGLELIERCKTAHPELKTLLISGTASPSIILRSSVTVDGFLAKPCQSAALLAQVRETLGQ